MTTLRSPEGCGWDKKQTLASLKKHLLEETYEVLESIDDVEDSSSQSNINHHCEELGDLLLQVIFQSEIQKENENFNFDDVCSGLCEKLERRHPHIFGSLQNDPNSEENPYWEAVKAKEKGSNAKKSLFSDIPKSFTALMRAQKTSSKAAHANFTWPTIGEVLKDVDEEMVELKEAIESGDRKHIEHELGDAIYALVNVARFLKIDAECATQGAVDRFHKRFYKVEEKYNFDQEAMKKASVQELDAAWNEAKILTS